MPHGTKKIGNREVMLYWTLVKTSAKTPDQISGRHRSRDCSITGSLQR